MRQFRNSISNPLLKWLLRSPFHSMVSKKYMLITVTGRKSGKIYTTPVEYALDGDTLTVVSSASYLWWKNLRATPTAQVRIAGRDLTGTATIDATPEAAETALRRLYPQMTEPLRNQIKQTSVAITIHLK